MRLTPREPQPEVVAEQAVRLGLVLQQAGALRPSGHVSTLLRAEWQAACQRLGQQLIVTVQNASRTWAELEGFLQQRGRPFPPELLDLEVFITEATPAPARSLASLRWILPGQGQHGLADDPVAPTSGISASQAWPGSGDGAQYGQSPGAADRPDVRGWRGTLVRASGWLVGHVGSAPLQACDDGRATQDYAECRARPLSQGEAEEAPPRVQLHDPEHFPQRLPLG